MRMRSSSSSRSNGTCAWLLRGRACVLLLWLLLLRSHLGRRLPRRGWGFVLRRRRSSSSSGSGSATATSSSRQVFHLSSASSLFRINVAPRGAHKDNNSAGSDAGNETSGGRRGRVSRRRAGAPVPVGVEMRIDSASNGSDCQARATHLRGNAVLACRADPKFERRVISLPVRCNAAAAVRRGVARQRLFNRGGDVAVSGHRGGEG